MNHFENAVFSESRWARKAEMQKSAVKINLEDEKYPAAGLPVVCDGKTAYVDDSDSHTIIFGATGSKKTRLFCFPMINMLIRAGESFVATDPKGELYNKTAQAAKENGYKTIVLNFRDIGKGDCWNPLEAPYKLYHNGKKDKAMGHLNDFVTSISQPHRENTKDLFWIDMAASLAIANLLLLMECGEPSEVHLGSLANLCSMSSTESLMKISDYINETTIAGLNYRGVFSSAEKTRQSIQVSLYAWVRIFNMQRNLSKMLSVSTFDCASIGKEKTAVYLIIPDEKSTYDFLVTTFIKQVYETLIDVAQESDGGMLPVRVNFILDEFCNLPQIPDMTSMISAARSRNMRYFLIVQGIRQLTSQYKEDAETIKGNCNNWVFLASKELVLLQEISELCGTIVTPGGYERRLISVSELQRLNKEKGEALLLYGREYPYLSELPDIDDYAMFRTTQTPPIEQKESGKYCMFLPDRLLRGLKLNPGLKLFADEILDE